MRYAKVQIGAVAPKEKNSRCINATGCLNTIVGDIDRHYIKIFSPGVNISNCRKYWLNAVTCFSKAWI
jgi:hypothetical protein